MVPDESKPDYEEVSIQCILLLEKLHILPSQVRPFPRITCLLLPLPVPVPRGVFSSSSSGTLREDTRRRRVIFDLYPCDLGSFLRRRPVIFDLCSCDLWSLPLLGYATWHVVTDRCALDYLSPIFISWEEYSVAMGLLNHFHFQTCSTVWMQNVVWSFFSIDFTSSWKKNI